jgi:hypothetical protein
MKASVKFIGMAVVATICIGIGIWLFVPRIAGSHCDTLAGPVVMTAKEALYKGDVTPVLKWVKKEQEGEIREAFKNTLAVRKLSPEARKLADMYFFETLVRLHRAGEGAPYTGLKPGEVIEPIIAEADKALEKGSVDDLVKHVTDAVAKGIRERFTHVKEAKKNADKSIEAGREFVEAYVVFTHYVEGIYEAAKKAVHAHHPEQKKGEGHKHY